MSVVPPHMPTARRRPVRPPVEREPTAADRARAARAREEEYGERLRAALAEVTAPGVGLLPRDRDLWPITRQWIYSAAVTAAGTSPGHPYEDALRIRREVLGPLLDALAPAFVLTLPERLALLGVDGRPLRSRRPRASAPDVQS